MILWRWLQNIETITKIAKSIWNYESHYRYPMMVSELLKWTTFVLLLSLSKLWRHCYFIKVSILYILGLLPTPPSPWHPFWMIPYRKIIENYRNKSLLNWYGYCGTDMKILETKLLLQNWFGNIEFYIDIAKFTVQYWNHFWYC